MGPFNFLGSMQNGLNQYFAPSLSQANNTLSQFFPSKSLNYRMDASPKAPDIHPLIAAGQPQPQQQTLPMPSQVPMQEPQVDPFAQPVNLSDIILSLLVGGGFRG